jgi:hypothetical protein
MVNFDELSALLVELKGPRASVLWALSLAGRPLSVAEILALTGYSRKPVRRAVRELLGLGLIRHDGPRVLTMTGAWPYQVVDTTAQTGQTDRGDTPQQPADKAPKDTRPAPGAGMATQTVQNDPAPVRPEGTFGPTFRAARTVDSRPPAAVGESTASLAQTPREEELAQVIEERRRAFVADKMAAAAAGISAETASLSAAGQKATANSTAGRGSGPIDLGNQSVVVVDPDPDHESDQQQQQIPDGAGQLATLLRRMGVNGRAYWRLVQRDDLAGRPEVVLAWWWYYRVQEGIRNPAGAAISRLDGRHEPPEGYLALARLWPTLGDEVRQELESLVLHNWSAEQIANRLRPECPGLTPGAVLAFMTLSLEELGG